MIKRFDALILSPEARAYVEKNGIKVGDFVVRDGVFPVVDPLTESLCPEFAREYVAKVARLKRRKRASKEFEPTDSSVDHGEEMSIVDLSKRIGVPEMTIYSWVGDDKVKARKVPSVSVFADGRRVRRKIWLVNVESAMVRYEIWLTYRAREKARSEKRYA